MNLLKKSCLIALAGAIALAASPLQAETELRFLGQFLPTQKHFPPVSAALDVIDANQTGVKVVRNEYKALGLQTSDGLRLARSGTFDVVAVQIGSASRDDAFLEGLDLIGVSTDMKSLRDAVNAYREAFDLRLREKFGATVLALWPFGPQMFFCNQPLKTVDDLKGLKVRSFTPSMSALLKSFGATAVTLNFPEVYPALQRNVASCGVTSPTSGNTGKWPEVTSYQLPLSVSGSVQGYFANLEWWDSLSDAQRAGIKTAFQELEDNLWDLSISLNDDALACNTGQDTCKDHEKFDMKLVEISPADVERVKAVSQEVVLPEWLAKCEKSYSGCTEIWNSTVGKVRGISATAAK